MSHVLRVRVADERRSQTSQLPVQPNVACAATSQLLQLTSIARTRAYVGCDVDFDVAELETLVAATLLRRFNAICSSYSYSYG